MTSEQMCVCGHQRSVHTWHAEETDTPGCGLSSCSCGVFRTVQEEALTSQQESVHKHAWDGAYCACGAVRDQREAPASKQRPTLLQMAETALGQWLNDFGSTNELSQRSRIILDLIRQDETPQLATSKDVVKRYVLRIGHSDDAGLGGEGWAVRMSDHFSSYEPAQKWVKAEDYDALRNAGSPVETTDDHEADLANQLHEVDRAFRGCLKELDTLRARVPASDYVLVIDMGETHHKEYGQVLFATHDAIHAVEPRETTVSLATYESVVKGRSDFRQAYRQARSLLRQFIAAWEGQPNHENMDRLCEAAREIAGSSEEPSADGLTEVRDRTANVALTCGGACRYHNSVFVADPECGIHFCPKCNQSMPGCSALHTDYCPENGSEEQT